MKIFILKCLLLSFLVTILSSFFHSVSDNSFELLNCSHSNIKNCRTKVIAGGFPTPFIYDNPNNSDKSYLSINDNIEMSSLLLDWAFYFGLVALFFGAMKSKTFVYLAKILLLSLILTLFSCQYQRPSKERFPAHDDCESLPCSTIKVLSGGFPLRYVYDSPSVSVRNSISIEDDWHLIFFIYDMVFYLFVVMFGTKLIQLLKKYFVRRN